MIGARFPKSLEVIRLNHYFFDDSRPQTMVLEDEILMDIVRDNLNIKEVSVPEGAMGRNREEITHKGFRKK